MLGGVVVIEAVFGWPGIGAQAVRAISQEDLPVLMGTLLLGTLAIVVASLGRGPRARPHRSAGDVR